MNLGRGSRPLRIAYGRIFHEANAHTPLFTVREDFERMHHVTGDELARASGLRGVELKSFMPHAELTGFLQAARLAGGVETIPLASSLAVPGGALTAECFAWLVDDLLERIERAGRLDGIYLALHGAMQVEGLRGAPEAEILRRVRERTSARIAVSYDLHGNLSAGLIEPVDVLCAYRTNPHWDLAPTGFRAGNRLIRTLRGQCRPVHAWRKLPMVLGGGMTIDFLAPMRPVFRHMRALEDDRRVLSASIFMVHPYTAAENLCWAVHVSADADRALAERLADELADRVWAEREAELPPMRTVDAALDEVASGWWKHLGPVSLVDIDDIVGAGAPGGSTQVVASLAANDRGLCAFVPVHDPTLVEEIWPSAIGERCRAVLRGTPGYGQPEVALDATLAAKVETDFGRTLRLDVGKFHVAVTERPPLPFHPSFWRQVGLSPRRADVIVQKNFFHYRMFYATTSFHHLPVVSDGATSLERVKNREYRTPMYPQHAIDDWRRYDPVLRA